jgi:hypothetical protein
MCHNIGVGMSWSNPLLTLYHGTVKVHANDILKTGVQLRSNRALDFGTGFYTTTSQSQARNWAITVSRLSQLRNFPDDDRKPVVLRFSVHRDDLAKFEFLGFVCPTEDYWQLVKHCRGSSVNTNRRAGTWYDVCLGPLAQNWDINPPRIKPNSDQISFHTEEVIRTLLVRPIIEDVL